MSRLSSEIELLTSGTRLSILARHIVDGFMIGMHHGTRRGTGTEFSQFRSYQPGDDIRQIDWKMYARSDRYYIKEAEIETSVTLRFFLDASASMLYEENGYTRFQYASLLTAALGTLAHKQGDAFALHIVNNNNRRDLTEKRGKNQLNRFYQMIETAECEGIWPESSKWVPGCLGSHRRELWIVCSDMLDGTESWKSFAEMGQTFGNEILFLQVLGEQELNLSLPDAVTVQDPESRQKLNIRTEAVRKKYLQNLQAYQSELRKNVRGKQSDIELISMAAPVGETLQTFLNRRSRL